MSSISRTTKLISWLCIFVTQSAIADLLPIGVSLNMSGKDAQYALEFKNGIDAYLKAANKSKRFDGYKIKLIAMDDFGKAHRSMSNVKRLVKQKKVLAILSNHPQSLVEQTLPLATKHKTLFLSSGFAIDGLSRKESDYSAFLASTPSELRGDLGLVFEDASNVFILSEGQALASQWRTFFQARSPKSIKEFNSVEALEQALTKNAVVISNEQFLTSANHVSELLTHPSAPKFLILPESGATLFNRAIAWQVAEQHKQRIFYLNTVPLHKTGLKLIRQFKRDMTALNPKALTSHQALKGYVLTMLTVESIYHSVKGIQTDSLIDVATLPFQVLDQVVGWVSRAGGDVSGEIVAAAFARMKNHNIGANQLISVDKSRELFNYLWLTQTNQQNQFVELSQLERKL